MWLSTLWRCAGVNSVLCSTAFFDLGRAKVLLHAESLGFDVRSRNAVFDQEAPGTLYPPFGKRLIVFGGGSRVGMALQNQVGVGLSLEILFEIGGERNQRFLLAGQQSRHRDAVHQAGR